MMTSAILIVERNDTFREKRKRFLLQEGYQSIESSNKTEAIGIIQCSVIHLVIVGSLEGKCDSIQIAQEICQRNSANHLILITHDSTKDLDLAALKLGIDDYF